ncbi:hypothetical protein VPH35_091963 [Triticum aestivum]
MTFRAVCRSWRAATDEPCGLSRRFRPHRWAMLDDLSRHVDSRLFLNIDTGRFLRKNVPLLNDGAYTYVGAADVDTGYGYDMCILNPFTGSILRFPTGLSSRRLCSRVAVTADATAPLVFLFLGCLSGVCYDPSNPLPRWFSAQRSHAYIADVGGSVKAVDCPKGPHTNPEITTIIKHNSVTERSFLVDNVGELLLVPSMPGHPRYSPFVRRMHVFRLDLERKALEPIKSIGNRAIFLGLGHCLSIDANHLPAIEANCIYYYNVKEKEMQMYLYHLEDGSRELLTSPPIHGPSSLARIIIEYCRGRSNYE